MKKILLVLTLFVATNTFAQTEEVKVPKPPPQLPIEDNEDSDDDDIFQKVEVESEFVGGAKAWREFLQKNLNADVPANKKAKAGIYTVIVAFVVNRDGTLSNFKLETNPGYGTGEEVLRVMKKSPKWKPGYQNGIRVSSLKRQPISFQVTN